MSTAIDRVHEAIRDQQLSTDEYVTLAPERVFEDVAEKLIGYVNFKDLSEDGHSSRDSLSLHDRLQLHYFFNAVNFCFWVHKEDKKWNIEDDNIHLDGSMAMLCVLQRTKFYALKTHEIKALTLDEFQKILGGEGTLLLMQERLDNIKMAAKLLDTYGGTYDALVHAADGSATKLLEILQTSSAFQDVTEIQGRTIPFLKRAQLLIKDTNDCLPLSQKLKGIESFTAFSDYKVPQILEAMGLLIYDTKLRLHLDQWNLIGKDSPEEGAIRLATLRAVERLRGVFNNCHYALTSGDVDFILWKLAQKEEYRSISKVYHRTLTTAY